MIKIVEYFTNHLDDYLQLVYEHILISFLCWTVALMIAIPLGIICSKYKFLQKISESLFGFLRIVPSMALLFLLIPVMGTGLLPALFALVVLAVPPILINTTQAFINIDEKMIEVAKGLGMGNMSIFWKVKLPLAFPSMFPGIRSAAIEVIASATLASYIGAGGLGNIIFTGLGLMRTDLLYIGGLSVAILSFISGLFLDLFFAYKTRYLKKG